MTVFKGFSASYSVEGHFKTKIAQELFRRKFTHKYHRLSIVSKFYSVILGTSVPRCYHQLQVHQRACTQFYSALQKTLMRSLRKKGSSARVWALASEVEIFSRSQGRDSDINHYRENSHCQGKNTHGASGGKELTDTEPLRRRQKGNKNHHIKKAGRINREIQSGRNHVTVLNDFFMHLPSVTSLKKKTTTTSSNQ